MKEPVFTGAATALITPFRDGEVDYKRLDDQLDFQIKNRSAAVVVSGSTGESTALSFSEYRDLLTHVCMFVNGRIKVVAGAGASSTQETIVRCHAAESAGADAVMLAAPPYCKPTQTGLRLHFLTVADQTSLPVILYNVPGRTAVSMTEETCAALADHPRINGIKEASGSPAFQTAMMAACGDRFHVWCGNDQETVQMMALGAKGVISVASNLLPGEIAKICSLCMSGQFSAAAKKHLRLAPLYAALFRESNPIPIKKAMALAGLDSGELRLPLTPLSPAHAPELENVLRELHMIP